MSRSTKKLAKKGVTSATSEKQNKRRANRKYRRVTKNNVKAGRSEQPQIKQVSNSPAFDKDGKVLIKNPTPRDFRK